MLARGSQGRPRQQLTEGVRKGTGRDALAAWIPAPRERLPLRRDGDLGPHSRQTSRISMEKEKDGETQGLHPAWAGVSSVCCTVQCTVLCVQRIHYRRPFEMKRAHASRGVLACARLAR